MTPKNPALFVALVLAGCAPEYPPPEPVAQYYPPPRPSHSIHHATVAAVEPRARPEESKPASTARITPDKIKRLGQGMLTALTVGDYMDGQEKDLRAKLRGNGIIVSRVGDNLVLNIRSDRLFDGEGATLSGEGDAIVHAVADSVRRFDSTTVSVNGFTDAAAAPQKDVKISQMNAEAVDRALIENGVDPHRVSAKGFGAGDLKVPGKKDARNRRVEIDITPRVRT